MKGVALGSKSHRSQCRNVRLWMDVRRLLVQQRNRPCVFWQISAVRNRTKRKKLLLHALEQLKKEMQLDTETEGNWEAAMYVNVAIQKVNLALVANDQLKHPTVLALLAKGVREFPAEAFTVRGTGATKYYRADLVKNWMNTVMETVNDAI